MSSDWRDQMTSLLVWGAVCLAVLSCAGFAWLLSRATDDLGVEERKELSNRAGALAACGPTVLPIDITDEGFYWKVICPDPRQGRRVVIYEEDAS